ncbi:MAG: hypothetical protein ACJ74O_04870 [Frankiaceae bacterium]
MAWLTTIPRSAADGELADVYAAMAGRPMPAPYVPSHGDASGIIRAHSLDPALMRLVFGLTGPNHPQALSWELQELLSAATSRANDCFY